MSVQVSACRFLFGKEAGDIFNLSEFSADVVNQSLETLMKVNVAFLSRKEEDGFPLLDPVAGNNQCHLYSLFAARVKKGYQAKTSAEKHARTQENRFLHLSFLLSFPFLTKRPLLHKAITMAELLGEVTLPIPKKQFNAFVNDPHGTLVHTARQALNEVFEKEFKEKFAEAKDRSLLHRELYEISREDLSHRSEQGKQLLYTIPKLVGVAYLILENVPIVIKTKVITKEGTGALFYQSRSFTEDEPVLVFEAMTSDTLSMKELMEHAELCPHYFRRRVSQTPIHNEEKSCLFCNPEKIDVAPFEAAFKKATASLDETLYASGADFVQQLQPEFKKRFFQDNPKYPLLTEIFERGVANIEGLGVSMNKPLAFTVHHVSLDNGRHARSKEFQMNVSPKTYLEGRGFI